MAKRKGNINCIGKQNDREGEAFRFVEVEEGGMGSVGNRENRQREGEERERRKVMRAEKEGDRETRKGRGGTGKMKEKGRRKKI